MKSTYSSVIINLCLFCFLNSYVTNVLKTFLELFDQKNVRFLQRPLSIQFNSIENMWSILNANYIKKLIELKKFARRIKEKKWVMKVYEFGKQL